MMRTALLMTALALGTVGCVTLKPVGPLAKNMAPAPGSDAPKDAVTKVTPAKDIPSGPIIQPAPAPTPPKTDVTPGEVTESNTADIVRRLQAELDADRKSAEAMPRPSEISLIK